MRIRLGLSAVEASSDLSQIADGDKVGNLQTMEEVSRLDFLPEEERLWSLTAEPISERTATSWSLACCVVYRCLRLAVWTPCLVS